MSVKSLTPLLLIGATLFAVTASAQVTTTAAMQSLRAVQRAAEAALRRELDVSMTGVELTATALDERLRLARCAGPLDASAALPRLAQIRVLVRVACRTSNWNVNVSVEIHRTSSVLVLRRAVARGESIAAGDVTVQTRVLPGLSSPFVGSVAELNGRLTRRTLPEGAAVPADALNPALLIHRGQNVTLTVSISGIEVRAPGLAMGDASANQRVRVQNLNSLKIVEGVADSEGVVRVHL
jgi:flagella basal body P-ring formation protein FlgA